MRIDSPRSGYDVVGGLVFFGRTLDKIRLHAEDNLPKDYNLGNGLDRHVLSLVQVEFEKLVERTAKGGTDEEILEWCFATGHRPSEREVQLYNEFMRKRGWRDEISEWVREQKDEMGLSHRDDIQTCLDIHDADEGRPPRYSK